ncbi:hypothetical protein OAF27_00965, partial [Verrucomicrobiales bacterium]|nr:hypothetical protein [Verrucomicrobiales bacterium]
MRKLVTIYTLAVLLPSILLAALALRAQGGQELVIRQQRALVHQATVDALAAEAADFIESEYSTFVGFAETNPQDWPTPASHFTVSAAGDLITPPEDLGENRDFLQGDAAASLYNNYLPIEPLEPQQQADKAFESYRTNKAQTQSTTQSSRSLFRSKRQNAVDSESAENFADSKPGGIASASPELREETKEVRRIAPQSLPAPVASQSSWSARTTAFSRVVAENPSGTIARYVGSTLYLIFYHRVEKTGEIQGAIIDPTYLRTALAGLVDIVTGAPEEACIALLDGDAKPVATSIPDFVPQDTWRRPFVAAEIGTFLPRWEVAAYFTDPFATTREARAAWLRIALAIAAVLTAITGGGLFIAL